MEQLVARRAHNPKVTGSSPVPATLKKDASASFFFGRIAFFWARIRNATANWSYWTPIRVLSPLLHKTDQLFTDLPIVVQSNKNLFLV